MNFIKFQLAASSLGVSAFPVDDSMFVWHANIKAMSDNHFKGGVLHLEFRFSDFYPLQPPKIRVLNDNISHPNILKCGSICLDMLDIGNGEPYKGWTPAYSVFSILLQLQNFFFDHDFIFETDELRKEAIETVRVMNEYKCKCKSCGHKGASNPKPDFPNIDSKDKFVLSKEQLELLKKNEHSCIIKKTNFEEAPLGYGVSIIRIPRTGEIKGISITQEYLSLKAFQKQRIRNIFTKKGGFTHWLPLYFGNKESLGQFKHLSERAISMITTGTTRNFSPEQINKVYCKIISFMILEFTQDNSTLCSKAIKTLIHIFKAYRLMLDFYPDQQKFIEDSVNKFIKDPAHRIKDNTSSLGDLLSFSLMTENNCHKDLIPPYVDESMDRSIFWIIKLLPELEELINSSKIDDVRSKVCFSAASKSNYLLSIFYYFNAKVLQKESKTCTEINLELDKCYGNLDEDIIYQHVKKIKEILKIDNFGKLYESIGLKNLNESEMNNKIKQAFQNSLSKNYHGGEDEVRFVPDERTQINVLLNKFASVGDLVNKNELLPAEDPIWKKLCSSLDISKKLIYDQPSVQLTPDLIAAEYEKATLNEYYYSKPDNFRNVSSTDEYFIKQTTSDLGVETEKEFLSKLTFREVYLKIFLEFYIKNFRYILDFKELYSLLDTFAPIISHLTIIVNKDDNIKSDYNYIRAVISKLTKVKILKFIINTNISLKLIKNIIKGYSIFIKEGGETEYLKIFNDKIYSSHTCQEYNILSILDKMSKLKCLDCSNTKLNNYVILRIRNQLYYHKTLQSLVLSNCDINDDMAKELADGIMKAKNLKHIDLSSNITNKGLSSVVYNLAFQPLLNSLNLSNSGKVDAKELSSALYKLIKMSMSLENLDASNVIGLNSNLSVDFFASLGDNSYLKKLNLSGSGSITENNLLLLGNSLAFNSLKKGSLVEVYLSNCGITYPGLVKFVDGMFVSEHLHNQWYNSPFNSEITKESKEYYVKYFNCAITYLNLSQNNFTTNIMINDPKNLSPNHLQYLTNQNLNLTELILDNITNNKNFVDLIVNALHSANSLKTLSLRSSNLNGDLCRLLAGAFGTKEKPNQFCKISYLDLALNHFGYSGIEAFSNILQFNKTLEVISFYHGLFDVNGARRLAEALEVNTSLKILDIGYNRIKDLGLNTIISSIEKNKNSKLTVLLTCIIKF